MLHLGHDDALADGVQRAGRDKKQSPLCTGTAFRTSVRCCFDALRKLLFGNFVRKAVVKVRARHAVQHIPHLAFAVLVFFFKRVPLTDAPERWRFCLASINFVRIGNCSNRSQSVPRQPGARQCTPPASCRRQIAGCPGGRTALHALASGQDPLMPKSVRSRLPPQIILETSGVNLSIGIESSLRSPDFDLASGCRERRGITASSFFSSNSFRLCTVRGGRQNTCGGGAGFAQLQHLAAAVIKFHGGLGPAGVVREVRRAASDAARPW